MNQQITALLQKDSAASAMTHSLSILGNGDMGEGIRYLWLNGYKCGTVAGVTACAAVLVGGIAAYRYVAVKLHRLHMLGAAANEFSTDKENEE